MSKLSRRSMLAFSLVGLQSVLAACGGGGSSAPTDTRADAASAGGSTPAPAPTPSAPVPAPAPAVVWDVGATLGVVADAKTRFDVSSTLPASVKRGGTFGVSPTGAALPAGVTLSALGILQASTSVALGSVAGVVFSYDEPSA